MGEQVAGTGLYYTGDVKDVMHGREDPEKFVRLFEPDATIPMVKSSDTPVMKAFYFPPSLPKMEKESKMNALMNWLMGR